MSSEWPLRGENRPQAELDGPLRCLFAKSPHGLILGQVIRDGTGKVVDWRYLDVNPAWSDWVGIPREDAVGRRVRQVVPGIEDEWIDTFAPVVDRGVTSTFIRKIGVLDRWYEGKAFKVGADRFAVIFSDVTDRERQSLAIQSLRAELQLNVEERNRAWKRSTDLFFIAAFDSTILDVNEAWTTSLGWSRDELLGRPFLDFVHPDDIAKSAAEIASLRAVGTTQHLENRLRRNDGDYSIFVWTADAANAQIHGIGRDVSRERRALAHLAASEDALRQSQKMEAIGQLTGGIAHDFNNLLTIIGTSLELVSRPNVSAERRPRFIESIRHAVARAAKLTSQLLAFARRQALQPVVFDASSNVTAIVEMLETLVGPRVRVDLIGLDRECRVDADPGQFDTAIVNIAANARDAMNGVGTLRIETRTVDEIPALRAHAAVRGSFVVVSLTDTGAGIPAEHINKVFEPFYTTKPVGQGTGLGLSQVVGFAKQSGGDVQILSELGHGTTVSLYLPAARRASSDAGIADEAAIERVGGRLLLVEDNREVAEAVTASLVELEYDVTTAGSGEQALRLLEVEAAGFDAVFCDVVMEGMGGIALAKEVRRRFPKLPIVLSSGYSDVLADETDIGFPLLAKPYSVSALERMLGDAIANRPTALPRTIDGEPVHRDAVDSEVERLIELETLNVLDTEAEPDFDELTRMAALLFDAPIALISLVDDTRQWFKSRVGLEASETPREYAFCAHAIEAPSEVMVVPDASQDDRFSSNPLVTGDPNIRFYAGAPLVTSRGHALGTICVIDSEPRTANPQRLKALEVLASQVVERLERRRRDSD